MPQGAATQDLNSRNFTQQHILLITNGEPTPAQVLPCASTNAPTASTAFAVGQAVQLQADTPGFVGFGATAAIAQANALGKARRLDAWEPLGIFLSGQGNQVAGSNNPSAFVAYVLQSAGSGNLYISTMT